MPPNAEQGHLGRIVRLVPLQAMFALALVFSPARARPIEAGSSPQSPTHLDGLTAAGEHQFEMAASSSNPQVMHRTARICLRTTPAQGNRCYRLLRAAGDVWAWLLDSNRDRRQQGNPAVVGYQALCRQLTSRGGFGELSVVGARSVLQRYSDAWFEAARRHNRGERAGFPRRKRFLAPIRFYNGTFLLAGDRRVRLPVAKGHPELWVRLARPVPYPPPTRSAR
jgi:hypothetical protein